MNDFRKLETPRGDGARAMTALSPTSVTLNFDQTGQDWFGPRTPMLPIAPPEIAGRSLDFMPGHNLVTEPRANEPVTFAMLRSLADSVDIVRVVIERRKDQMCRMPWTIRVKHDGNGKRPSAAALSSSTRNKIRDVQAFFKSPTYGVNFREWLRTILEDHFVIDSVALYQERSRAGELLGLRPIDGGLIKRVIDSWGQTPKPIPWNGEPYRWNGLQITTENFRAQGFKVVNGYLLPPAYQQILKGLPGVDYTTHDLIYKIMNQRSHSLHGFSPVEQILNTINTAMRRSASQLEYFREGNQPAALFSLPETWTPDQIQRYQEYFDNLFVGNLGTRRQMKFVAGGGKSSYTPIHEPPLKSEFDEWLARIVCFAFSYSPAALMALNNRSTSQQHAETGEEEGLQGTKLFVSDLVNGVIEEEFDDTVEFTWVEEDEIDQEKQSTILTAYTSGGIMTVNEARDTLGLTPSADPSANQLMVQTVTGDVPVGQSTKTPEK